MTTNEAVTVGVGREAESELHVDPEVKSHLEISECIHWRGKFQFILGFRKSRRSRSSSSSSSESDSSSSRSSSYSSRSRSRTPQRSKASKRRRSNSRVSEDSDDAREKRQMKQLMKEKEQAYHARLKRWESRERGMSKKYEREERKEKDRKKSLQKEGKRLKLFLEDYDDEKDDPKYYKSSQFFQRKRDYEREREADQKDRIQEIQEIEELKKQIMEEAANDESINIDEEARKRHKLKVSKRFNTFSQIVIYQNIFCFFFSRDTINFKVTGR